MLERDIRTHRLRNKSEGYRIHSSTLQKNRWPPVLALGAVGKPQTEWGRKRAGRKQREAPVSRTEAHGPWQEPRQLVAQYSLTAEQRCLFQDQSIASYGH